MTNPLKKLSLTTGILLHLYVCGTIYLVTFWKVFDINVANFITLNEIPASCFYPLSSSFFLYLIHSSSNYIWVWLSRTFPDPKGPNGKELPMPKSQQIANSLFTSKIDATLAVVVLGLIICLFFFSEEPSFYMAAAYLLTLFLSMKIEQMPKVVQYVTGYDFRRLAVTVLIGTPIFCFFMGIKDGLNIDRNLSYKQVTIFPTTQTNTDSRGTFKLIGYVGTKMFVTDSLNTEIIMLNQAEVKVVRSFEYPHLSKKR